VLDLTLGDDPEAAEPVGHLRDVVVALTGDRAGGATTIPPAADGQRDVLGGQLEGTARALHMLWQDYERVIEAGRGGTGDAGDAPTNLARPAFAREALRLRATVEGATAALCTAAELLDDADRSDPSEADRQLAALLVPAIRGLVAQRGAEALAIGTRLAPPFPAGRTATTEELRLAFGPARTPRVGGALHDPPGQSIDGLLELGFRRGRGAALRALRDRLAETAARARLAGVPDAFANRVEVAAEHVVEVGAKLTLAYLEGDETRVRPHGPDFLDALGLLVVAWRWLALAAAAEPLAGNDDRPADDRAFARGLLAAADYWFGWELPRLGPLLAACKRQERPWVGLPPGAFG